MGRRKGRNIVSNILKPKILLIADGITEINYFMGYIEKELKDLTEIYDLELMPHMSNTRSIMNHIKKLTTGTI